MHIFYEKQKQNKTIFPDYMNIYFSIMLVSEAINAIVTVI